MLVVQLRCSCQREEELAAIVVSTGICHRDETAPNEPQARVEFILQMVDNNIQTSEQFSCI